MQRIAEDKLTAIYPTPPIRGKRISRMEERELGPFSLTAETARELGQSNVGVFIGGCGDLERTVELIRRIDACEIGGQWIAIPASRTWGAFVYKLWLDSADVWYVDPRKAPSLWTGNRVTFCLPESLRDLSLTIERQRIAVAGLLLLDLHCMVHKARGFNNGDFRVLHDRPQMIVDFRSRLSDGDWEPPLVCLSQKPAKSVPTESMRRAYCLEAFQFVDGRTLRCGPLPNQSAKILPTRTSGEPHSIVFAC